MAESKQLKFQFVVDEASLQKTRQLIRELIADLSKLNEIAGKAGGLTGLGGGDTKAGVRVSGGGANSVEQQRVIAKTAPAGRPLVQNLLDQKNAIKGVAEGSKESLRAMSQDLRQAVGDQIQQINRLKQAVDALQASYGKVRATAHDQLAEVGRSVTLPPPLPRRSRAELMPEVPWPERSNTPSPHMPSGGPTATATTQPGGPTATTTTQPGGFLTRFRKWLAPGGAPTPPGGGGGPPPSDDGDDGDGEGIGLLKPIKTPAGLRTAARIGGLVLSGVNAILNEYTATKTMETAIAAERGQVAQSLIDRFYQNDINLIMAMQSMDSTQTQDFLDNTVGTAGELNVGKDSLAESIGSLVTQNDKGIMGSWDPKAVGTAQARRALEHAQKIEASRPMENLATNKFRSELNQRIQFQRLTGTGGHGARDEKGIPRYVYNQLENELSREGYSNMEYAMAFATLKNIAGMKFAGENAKIAMAATAEGMSGFSDLMAAAARSGGGMTMALGALGGGIDRFAGVQLGQQIVGSGFDPRGTTSGLGVLQAVQGGMKFTKDAQDFNLAQRVGLGLQAGDAIVGGKIDPYQQARNLVGAINRLGPGATTYAQDFLANGMTMKQMVDIFTDNAKGTAIDTVAKGYLGERYKEIIRDQFGDSMTSILDRFVDQGGNDALSQAVRKFRESGSKDVSSFLKTLSAEERAMLGDFYGRQTGEGLEAGIGLMDMLAGIDNKNKIKKGYVGKKVTGLEADVLDARGEVIKEVNDRMMAITEKIINAYKQLPESFRQAAAFEGISASVDQFIKALGLAAQAVDEFRLKLDGKKSSAGSPTPEPTNKKDGANGNNQKNPPTGGKPSVVTGSKK
jgi:hypothetical protein